MVGSALATPTLTVTTPAPVRDVLWPTPLSYTLCRIASATCKAPSMGVSGRTTRNSSPP